jgi:hypothetical protein
VLRCRCQPDIEHPKPSEIAERVVDPRRVGRTSRVILVCHRLERRHPKILLDPQISQRASGGRHGRPPQAFSNRPLRQVSGPQFRSLRRSPIGHPAFSRRAYVRGCDFNEQRSVFARPRSSVVAHDEDEHTPAIISDEIFCRSAAWPQPRDD